MEQYISKSALVAEIDRQKIGYNVDGKHSVEYDTTRKILNIIDTLEVKEVNKNNEIVDKLHTIINFHKRKVFKGQWYNWMPEKISYHNGIISGIKQCLSIIRNR